MWRQTSSAMAARRLAGLSVREGLRPGSLACTAIEGPRANARRGISLGPMTEQAASAGYPERSMSQGLLDKCIEAALGRGVDVAGEYHPWLPVDLFQTMLVDIHEYAGCSWFTAITLTCIGIRVMSLPITIAAIRGAREKALIQPEFMELTKKQSAMRLDQDQEKNNEIQQKIQAFTQKHGRFFMMKGTWNLFLFQMPLYITAFAAMRGIASHPDVFRGFAMEAPLWLDSLALADPYCILPFMTSAIMLTNTELFGSIDTETAAASPVGETQDQAPGTGGAVGQNTMQKYQKHFMRGSAVMFIPFTMSFPAGVFIFMSTNMIAASVQTRLLRLPALERLLEIPPRLEQVTKVGATPFGPPALVPLGMALRHLPRQNLLGTAKPSLNSSLLASVAASLQLQRPSSLLLEMPSSAPGGVETRGQRFVAPPREAPKAPQVNPRYTMRRVQRPAAASLT
ncbi:unnamed protein product [Polarella glacialis]|uniref:Membrane insertase YidC/Oxa/ALB C-terminal domain-containing protein n=1 Tax=Polarella glacialis TaxID=89957 RepID=A0A813GPC6_POLGL|nr:unnamed protein product [Polarella glacialis]